MFDIAKFKIFAKKQLQNRWLVPILIAFVTNLLLFIFSLPIFFPLDMNEFYTYAESGDTQAMLSFLSTSLSSPAGIISYLLSLIQTLVSFIFSAATLHVCLKMTRSPEPVYFKDFIDGFAHWWNSIKAGLWQSLWIFIWMFVSIFALTLVSFAIISIFGTGGLQTIVCCFIFVFSFVLFIRKTLEYSMTMFIIVEFPTLTARKSLNLSKILTKRKLWDLLMLELSFIGYIFLCIVTLGIAFIWFEPYYNMTKTNAYHGLLKEAVENGLVKQEDLA